MSEEVEMLEWMTLETFGSLDEAKALVALLGENAIEANLVNDANMGGDPLGLDFQNRGADSCIVKVHAKDIERARRILEAGVRAEVSNADEISMEMLGNFSDEELLDILQKQDEWNPENVILAQRILESHGKVYSEEDLKRFFDERVEVLRQPVAVGASSVVLAFFGVVLSLALDLGNFVFLDCKDYLYALLASGFCACLSFIAGLNWTYRRKRLPNGEKVFAFSSRLRRIAFIELVLSALALGLVVLGIAMRTI